MRWSSRACCAAGRSGRGAPAALTGSSPGAVATSSLKNTTPSRSSQAEGSVVNSSVSPASDRSLSAAASSSWSPRTRTALAPRTGRGSSTSAAARARPRPPCRARRPSAGRPSVRARRRAPAARTPGSRPGAQREHDGQGERGAETAAGRDDAWGSSSESRNARHPLSSPQANVKTRMLEPMDVDVEVEAVLPFPREVVAAYAGNPSHAPEWYASIGDGARWRTTPPVAGGSAKMAVVGEVPRPSTRLHLRGGRARARHAGW